MAHLTDILTKKGPGYISASVYDHPHFKQDYDVSYNNS